MRFWTTHWMLRTTTTTLNIQARRRESLLQATGQSQSKAKAPIAAFLSLELSCRQLYHKVSSILKRCGAPVSRTAKLKIQASFPKSLTAWHCIPCPPPQITNLDVEVKVGELFRTIYNQLDHHHLLFRPIFEVLKCYVHLGPRLSRPTPFSKQLKLDTVRISVSSLVPFEDMTHIFASPTVALGMLYGNMKALLARLARSGLLFGSIGALEVRLEDREFERLVVTSNLWDEQDSAFFQNAGLTWDVQRMGEKEKCSACGRNLPVTLSQA